MNDIKIITGPEINKRELPEEGKYLEIIWALNEAPDEKWDKEFENLLKKHLETVNPLFGPYKPKIIFNELLLTCSDEKIIEEQKKYFEKEFIEKVNQKLN